MKAQVAVDLTLLQVCSVPAGPSRNAGFMSGGVALLIEPLGCFGWRLTRRQAVALDQAGFACRSWTE